MSASLVGSEMCIRDRSRHPLSAAAGFPGRSAPAGWRGIHCTPACTRGPVSYTHLTLPTICSV
eukprot:616607-Alexandrium_andersonii.AAC.1